MRDLRLVLALVSIGFMGQTAPAATAATCPAASTSLNPLPVVIATAPATLSALCTRPPLGLCLPPLAAAQFSPVAAPLRVSTCHRTAEDANFGPAAQPDAEVVP
ncbi:MAG: hypothetical protein AB1586_08830 [Pseudomonadota bacterium]